MPGATLRLIWKKPQPCRRETGKSSGRRCRRAWWCLATSGTATAMVHFCWAAGTRTGHTLRRKPMRIEAITLREIRMPLVHFFETSFGRTTERRILLTTLHTEGLEGWGECVAGEDPFYSEESIDTAWYAMERYLAPVLLGKSIEKSSDK